MERREFIKKLFVRTGIGAGVAVAGTAGLIGYYQPRKTFYGTENVGERRELKGQKRLSWLVEVLRASALPLNWLEGALR